MNQFKRRIFLAVVGLSPQIITETLYALAVKQSPAEKKFIPTEIHVLTTTVGAQLVKEKLLDPKTGQFFKLIRDYPVLENPSFNDKNIHIITDTNNIPLTDIRNISDNTRVADTITTLLAELTNDPTSALHVSIAGGRKTMGFYLGYIFSLFARPHDQLSHVLVNSPFENHPDFYYPPKEPRQLKSNTGQILCTSEAKIELALIPVVKLRYVQPKKIYQENKSFSSLICSLQESYEPAKLYINLKQKIISCGKRTIHLPPALFAWLTLWAKRVIKEQSPASWRDITAENYLNIYKLLVGKNSASYEAAESALEHGMERDFFRQKNSKLRRILKDKLGPSAHHYLLKGYGKRPHTQYGLTLTKEQIEIITP